ncbi:hypothetical protein BGZ63DRAFT_389532 [Mariannaea sp. PMI_226]|nr:hypothetical protein BGZ63DRAFT_389532 [Mariannaea sp. PMI_226]
MSLPRPLAVFVALKNGHWKVGILLAVAIIQRLLPILVGASVQILDNDETCTVQFSVPLFTIVAIWLFVYVVLITWEALTEDYTRHLPRMYESIADLLSWTYASDFLLKDTIGTEQEGILAGNPLDINLAGYQDDDKDEGERWYMTTRLQLARKRYKFDLIPVHRKQDQYTVGIGFHNKNHAVKLLEPPTPVSCGLRRRKIKKSLNPSGSLESRGESTYRIAGAERFEQIHDANSETPRTMRNPNNIGPQSNENEENGNEYEMSMV